MNCLQSPKCFHIPMTSRTDINTDADTGKDLKKGLTKNILNLLIFFKHLMPYALRKGIMSLLPLQSPFIQYFDLRCHSEKNYLCLLFRKTTQLLSLYHTTHNTVPYNALFRTCINSNRNKFYVRRVRVAAIFDYFSIIFSKYSCVFTSDQLPVIIEKETVQYVKTQTCTA
jgi:hypothetical protein